MMIKTVAAWELRPNKLLEDMMLHENLVPEFPIKSIQLWKVDTAV